MFCRSQNRERSWVRLCSQGYLNQAFNNVISLIPSDVGRLFNFRVVELFNAHILRRRCEPALLMVWIQALLRILHCYRFSLRLRFCNRYCKNLCL